MSRGFVKEDDQEEAPFIPPRAALPQGVTNYVTPSGYQQLLRERIQLEDQITSINVADEKEKRLTRSLLSGKLNLLNERIASARIIDPATQPLDEVRFGAEVTFKINSGDQIGTVKRFQLVGVDEADIKLHKIAFVSPIAVALTGKKVGERLEFKRGNQVQELEIKEIFYDLTETASI